MLLLQTTTEINDVEAVAEIDVANVSSLILWSGDHIALHLTSMEAGAFPKFQAIAGIFNTIARHSADEKAPPGSSPNPVPAAPKRLVDEFAAMVDEVDPYEPDPHGSMGR